MVPAAEKNEPMKANGLLRFFSIDTVPGNRNFGLDVMRVIGLLMVFCGHSVHFFESWFPKIFRISHFVINGIELFFSLSGFLIGGLLIKGMIEKNRYTPAAFFDFCKRRWYKTLPVYYLAVGIIYLSGYFITGFHADFNFRFLFFSQNFFRSEGWFFPVSYSLAIEEWFYILFPLLFLLLVALFRRSQNPYRLLLVTALIFVLVSLGIRSWLYFEQHAHWDMVMRKSIITRFDSSVYGVMLAILFYRFKDRLLAQANLLLFAGLALHALSLFFRLKYSEGYFYHVIYFTTIPVSFALMIPWFYRLKVNSSFLLKFFTGLSLISYAYYLIHLSPLQEIMLHYLHDVSLPVMSAWFLVYTVVGFSLAVLWYKYIEKPFTDLRDK
ncbi:MAG: acyltransferase 3 [Bacteroidetes bacterium]|nr:MAG: acyltransferase 3 [Bacteroidota bacterium]